MQIIQAQVGNIALTEGQPLPVNVGDTIRVFYAFNYKMPETSGVRVWASLYQVTRTEKAQTKDKITLMKSLEWKPYEGEIDIDIGRVGSGTYGLICELPDYKDAEGNPVEDKIEDCIEVTAAPSPWEMIGPLLILGLMAAMVSMMAPMMKEGFS